MAKKKRKPTDTTLRNVRASLTRDSQLLALIRKVQEGFRRLADRMATLEETVRRVK